MNCIAFAFGRTQHDTAARRAQLASSNPVDSSKNYVFICKSRHKSHIPLAAMEAEDAYETAVRKFKADAAALEVAWAAQGDGNAAKVAASPCVIQGAGYRDMPWRRVSLWEACPRCQLPASGDYAHAVQKRLTAGCRWNGDAYGSNLYMCSACGFLDYSSWDEA
jgi:hypothetical protein